MKKILYSSPFVPPEWIAAHGFVPVRLIPKAPLETRPVRPVEGVCPYMRGFINRSRAVRSAAGIVVATTCDQMRRGGDLLQRNSSVPVFLMNVPATWQTSGAAGLYRNELVRLGVFLVEIGGKRPGRQALVRTVQEYDQKRTRLRTPAGRSGKGIPLALIGGPLSRQESYVFDVVRGCGGEVVLDGTETGERSLPLSFDRKRLAKDPLKELANAYFGGIPDAFRRPHTVLCKWLEQHIRERKARGVILLRHLWCDMWHAEVQFLRDVLKLPFLDLDLHEGETKARNTARIQAFMEALK